MAFLRRAPAGIQGKPGTLLCLSASFNPLTVAHCALIQAAGRIVSPDEVLLLLARANVDKAVTGLPLTERLDLLLRFAETRPGISVAATSHGRFVDKIQAILPRYPRGTRLVFLLGLDTLIRLFDPKYYRDRDAALARLFAKSECIVANRSPDRPAALATFLARPEVRPYASRIQAIELPEEVAAVSATTVRLRLGRGEPVLGLVPPEILPALTSPHRAGRRRSKAE